jgi:hypothetical protein
MAYQLATEILELGAEKALSEGPDPVLVVNFHAGKTEYTAGEVRMLLLFCHLKKKQKKSDAVLAFCPIFCMLVSKFS